MRILLGILLQACLIATAAAQQSGWPPAWFAAAEPSKIVGPIHFVGTRGLAAYLITTPAGHMLLDGGVPQTAGAIEASIRKLGFKPEDIKQLLITHAHFDHAGTTAHFKALSGANVAVMDLDVEQLNSGGRTDPVYGAMQPLHFPGVTADRMLKDGDTVSLGNIRMTARLGAGHTQGATTWVTNVEDAGRSYNVVFPCCVSVTPEYRLAINPSYPGIADDYARTFAMLETLTPDIWLAAHTETFGFEDKRARAIKDGAQAFVDPAGYRSYLADWKAKLAVFVEQERSKSKP